MSDEFSEVVDTAPDNVEANDVAQNASEDVQAESNADVVQEISENTQDKLEEENEVMEVIPEDIQGKSKEENDGVVEEISEDIIDSQELSIAKDFPQEEWLEKLKTADEKISSAGEEDTLERQDAVHYKKELLGELEDGVQSYNNQVKAELSEKDVPTAYQEKLQEFSRTLDKSRESLREQEAPKK